ncbi:transmembrane protein, putative, partial [Rhizoctonia solani AG-3 Rhs1AP]
MDMDEDEDEDGDEAKNEDQDEDEDDGEDDGEDGSDDDSELGEHKEPSNRPTSGFKGKVKSGDFTGTERAILDKTIRLVECHLLLVNYFLENHNLFLVIKKKWEMAVREKGEKLKCFPVDDRHFKAVKLRIQAFRGRLRDLITKAGPGILIAYDMQGLSQGSPKAIAAIDSKLPHNIHIKPGSKKGFGWFQHDFILEAVYHVLCVGRSPIAGEYPELFREFPTRLVTLICAIIHGILEKFKLKPRMGNKNKEEQLLLAEVSSYYKIHSKTMKIIRVQTRSRLKIRSSHAIIDAHGYDTIAAVALTSIIFGFVNVFRGVRAPTELAERYVFQFNVFMLALILFFILSSQIVEELPINTDVMVLLVRPKVVKVMVLSIIGMESGQFWTWGPPRTDRASRATRTRAWAWAWIWIRWTSTIVIPVGYRKKTT